MMNNEFKLVLEGFNLAVRNSLDPNFSDNVRKEQIIAAQTDIKYLLHILRDTYALIGAATLSGGQPCDID